MNNPSFHTRVRRAERTLHELVRQLQKRRFQVALVGESGTGKSSIINRLANDYIAPIGAIETTMEATAHPLPNSPLTLVDLPGYGTRAWPTHEFIEHFQLTQYDTALLILGARIKSDDIEMYRLLRAHGIPCYVVRNFIDIALEGEASRQQTDAPSYNKLIEQITHDARVQFHARELRVYAIAAHPEQPRFDLPVLEQDLNDAASEDILQCVRQSIDTLAQAWHRESKWTRARFYTHLAARTLTLPIPQTYRTVGMLVSAHAMGLSD